MFKTTDLRVHRNLLALMLLVSGGLVLACGSNSGPTAPELGDTDVSTASANKKGGNGGGQSGGGSDGATFDVVLHINGTLVGQALGAFASSSGTGFEEETLELNLSEVDIPPGTSCEAFADSVDGNAVDGVIAAGASKSPRTAENYTFVWGAVHGVFVNGVNHALRLGPSEDEGIAEIDYPNNWLPQEDGDVNTMRGTEVIFQVNKGRQKKNGCAGTTIQTWAIKVTRHDAL